jgi:hypothetical protein
MTTVQTTVPPNDSSEVCQYCGEPFPTVERLTLHRGLEHWSDIGEAERTAFHDARADEQDALSSFRLRALACIVALYFGFLFLYATFAI